MPTGDIKQCEIETHHARVAGRNECRCGYKGYPCIDCGERVVHAKTCKQYVHKPE